MNKAPSKYSFDFAVSFAGTDRSLAERLAALLSSRGAVVFIDTLYRAHLLGRRLDQDFQWVFGPATKYFVPIVSKAYVDRPWPQHEWSIAIREAQTRSEEFILPLRLDDSLLVGLPGTVGYIDLRRQSLEVIADLLMEKLTGEKRAEVIHWVATFGVLIEDVLGSGMLPSTVPIDYPYLCDWLARDLLGRLKESPITNPQITEDSRDGETFSVRVEFNWHPKEQPLEFAALDWWELLEVLPDDRVYEDAE
ncbi:MAG: TIR domain-containing protein [Acidobacteriota bacterium]